MEAMVFQDEGVAALIVGIVLSVVLYLVYKYLQGGNTGSSDTYFKPINRNSALQGDYNSIVVKNIDGDKRQQDVPDHFQYFYANENEVPPLDGGKPAWVYRKWDDHLQRYGFQVELNELLTDNGYSLDVELDSNKKYIFKVIVDTDIQAHLNNVQLMAESFNYTSVVATELNLHSPTNGRGEYIWVIEPSNTGRYSLDVFVKTSYANVMGSVTFHNIELMIAPPDWSGNKI